MKCENCGKEISDKLIDEILEDIDLELHKSILKVWCNECTEKIDVSSD